MFPIVKIVNGKTVIEGPTLMSTSRTVQHIKDQMGPSVIKEKGQKMSALDYKSRDSTDRWSKVDTQ